MPAMQSRVKTVDEQFLDRVSEQLKAAKYDEKVLSALEQFSGPMVDELFSRIATIESKAINVIGWSSALLGFLMLRPAVTTHEGRVIIGLAAVALVVAIVAGFMAAKARRWQWPTTRQWFCVEEFDRPHALRVQHLMALLRAYQGHTITNRDQASALKYAQWAILGAGLIVAFALLSGLAV